MTQTLRYGACKIPVGWYQSLIQSCAVASRKGERKSKRANAFDHPPLGLFLEKQVNTGKKVLWQHSGILELEGKSSYLALTGTFPSCIRGMVETKLGLPASRWAAENPEKKFLRFFSQPVLWVIEVPASLSVWKSIAWVSALTWSPYKLLSWGEDPQIQLATLVVSKDTGAVAGSGGSRGRHESLWTALFSCITLLRITSERADEDIPGE